MCHFTGLPLSLMSHRGEAFAQLGGSVCCRFQRSRSEEALDGLRATGGRIGGAHSVTQRSVDTGAELTVAARHMRHELKG